MDELIEQADAEQLRAALRAALMVIDQLSASTGAYIREDIVERVKESHLEYIAKFIGGA